MERIWGGRRKPQKSIRRVSKTAILWESILSFFCLAAVNGFHIEGSGQDELDALLGTEIGQPVPGEDAFDGNDEVLTKRFDSIQESLWTGVQVAVRQDLALLDSECKHTSSGRADQFRNNGDGLWCRISSGLFLMEIGTFQEHSRRVCSQGRP